MSAGQMSLFAPPCPDCGARLTLRPSREEGWEHSVVGDCTCGFPGIVGEDEGQLARACAVLRTWRHRDAIATGGRP